MMTTFAEYITTHELEPLVISVAANVRYLTVWNAMKRKPIAQDHAIKIKEAIFRLTGEIYMGELPIIGVEDHPTLIIKKIPRGRKHAE